MSTLQTAPMRSPLPAARGPISAAIAGLLRGEAAAPDASGIAAALAESRAGLSAREIVEDGDLQLALYLAYEVHYRSFDSVPPSREWDPALLRARGELEATFLRALTELVATPADVPVASVGEALFDLEAADDSPSLSRFVEERGGLAQMRELVIHRSAYQLKEFDPQSWVVPRLTGAPKVALLEIQFDEYGSGRLERMHSVLYATMMRALGLEDTENAHLGRLPGVTLATVNAMSAFGLRADLRGAAVGHLAMVELTSAAPSRRYGNCLRRLGFDAEVTDFFDEHVTADSVHENIAAYDLAGGLARAEPDQADRVLFGASALLALDRMFAEHVLGAWEGGESSLLPQTG